MADVYWLACIDLWLSVWALLYSLDWLFASLTALWRQRR